MKCCIIKKVAYRSPGTTRIVWANVLCECEGLALLSVPASAEGQPHSIVIAVQNVEERVFEPGGTDRFRLSAEEMMECGQKLRFLGKIIRRDELIRLLDLDDLGL